MGHPPLYGRTNTGAPMSVGPRKLPLEKGHLERAGISLSTIPRPTSTPTKHVAGFWKIIWRFPPQLSLSIDLWTPKNEEQPLTCYPWSRHPSTNNFSSTFCYPPKANAANTVSLAAPWGMMLPSRLSLHRVHSCVLQYSLFFSVRGYEISQGPLRRIVPMAAYLCRG
jgi:hypothetical protein